MSRLQTLYRGRVLHLALILPVCACTPRYTGTSDVYDQPWSHGLVTGFIGITDRRLIIYDKSFLGNRRAIVSVPHINVISVGSEDEGNLLSVPGFETSKLSVQTAVGSYQLEFRGHDKAYEAYRLILSRIL